MAIRYSLVKRSNTFTGEEKVYATTQMNERMELNEFAAHIQSHGSVFTRDTIIGVLTAAVDCLREQLLNGNKVSLGDLGSFACSLKSAGTETAEEFTSKDITGVNVTWSKGSLFKNLAEDATYEYVTTRKNQQEAKKALKEQIDNGTSGDTGGTGGTGGDGGDGGDDGDSDEPID